MKYTEKKALYESIMKEVGRIVKRRINNDVNEASAGPIDYAIYIRRKYGPNAAHAVYSVLHGMLVYSSYVKELTNILQELGDSIYNGDYERIKEIDSFCSDHHPKK